MDEGERGHANDADHRIHRGSRHVGRRDAGGEGGGAGDAEPGAYDLTPPRLSLAEGQVSFWRPGADDWATAQVNTPLVPGDEISTDSPGNIEIQIGSHAFVRGWTNTQIGLENQEADFIQFKLTDGSAAFDLRRLERGRTVEVDTPTRPSPSCSPATIAWMSRVTARPSSRGGPGGPR